MTAHCTTCQCESDPIPQPATSNDAHRRVLIQGVLAVVASKKAARTEKGDPK